jgi:superfamily II DNA or RNA helicase
MLATLVAPLEQPAPRLAPPPWLLPHQADAVLRARAILDRFGGALVADGVGLGKTYVALALAELERAAGGDALVVAPAALRREWQRAASEVGVPIAFVSHTSLARRRPRPSQGLTLLVVDEAHGFRNPRTRRYNTLARLAIGRRVLLLTATPINNSASDLSALIHLFAGAGDFRPFGVADLFDALRAGDGGEAALALGALTVSRSRRLVEAQFPALRAAFPRREPLPPVRYDLDAVYGGALHDILDAIAELDADHAHAERGAALLALGLLRRLESSRTAFVRTLRRHREFLREWAEARESGRTLDRAAFRAATRNAGDDPQLVLWPLLLGAHAGATPPATHPWRAAIERACDLALAAPGPDAKLRALEALLLGPLRGRKTIVFTEYRDTALAVARHLRPRVRLLCVAGDGAWAGAERLPRSEALDAFAPRARGTAENPLLAADLLVATDVASEGMNLQDASAVVNFDLPWNPVRVMQRIGRIDRLHSTHAVIAVAHLVPDHGLHDLTGTLRTLRAKLATLPAAAAPEPDPLSALWWLDADAPLPEAIERESWRRVEPFEARERWRAAIRPVHAVGDPCVAAGIARDDQPPAAGVLLALEWPGGPRIPLPFVLAPGGECRCDPAALGALAERALASAPLCATPADFATVLAAALPEARRRLLEHSAARHASQPRGPGRAAALRCVARAARTAARARDERALETLSRVTAALTRELPAGLDRAILDACQRRTIGDVGPLLDALLRACPPAPAAAVPTGSPRLRFVAALALAGRCPDDAG